MTDFVEAAKAAFGDLTLLLGYTVREWSDDEWWATVTWASGDLELIVSDDRRDRFVEVNIRRPQGRDPQSLLSDNGRTVLPLWAIVEAAGQRSDFYMSGEHRVERLPRYAEAAASVGRPFLTNSEEPMDSVLAAVTQRNWEWSEEGRKALRWLP